MKVFVVISKYMSGVQACAIYNNKKSALQHIDKNQIAGSPEVIELEVFGEQTKENHVFSASYYDPSYDIHILQGVYGNFEEAKIASGEEGQVLGKDIMS